MLSPELEAVRFRDGGGRGTRYDVIGGMDVM